MKFKKYAFVLLAALELSPAVTTVFAAATDTASVENFRRKWNEENDPSNIDKNYETNFYQLPLEAEVKTFPWTSSYFPLFLGRIAYRAKTDETPWMYTPPTRAQFITMTPDQVMALSPAEKYDIYNDRFDYPTFYSEKGIASPSIEQWMGLCHGWAPAAINYKEPRPVVMTSLSGLRVAFTSYDIKGLLSYGQGEVNEDEPKFLGVRCEGGFITSKISPACRGVNPGAFHIVMANEIGRKRVSFAFDRDPSAQVWNQPVVGYKSEIIKESRGRLFHFGAAPGTKKRVYVKTTLIYTDEVQADQWDDLNVLGLRQTDEVEYYYRLELDANNRIIGGRWKSDMRPDFIWRQTKPKLTGYYANIETIYNASIKK